LSDGNSRPDNVRFLLLSSCGTLRQRLSHAANAAGGHCGSWWVRLKDGCERFDPVDEAGAGTDDQPVGVDRPHRQSRQLASDHLGLGGGGVEVDTMRTMTQSRSRPGKRTDHRLFVARHRKNLPQLVDPTVAAL
jgi:hypothetical protein